MKVLLEDIERERAKTAAAENRISEVDKERRETAAKVSDLEAKISKLTRDTTKMKHDHEKQLKDVNDRVLNAVRLLGFKGDRLPGWRNIFRFFFNLFKFHFKANELAGHGSDDDDLDFDGGGKKYVHFILNVGFGLGNCIFFRKPVAKKAAGKGAAGKAGARGKSKLDSDSDSDFDSD